MRNKKVYNLVVVSMIAALYSALTIFFAPISFNVIQFRLSEMLTILPLFTPLAISGLSIGCFISNLIGMFMGQTLPWDLIYGTLATIASAFITYYIGKINIRPIKYIFGPLPAVIINAIVVGYELSTFFGGNILFNMAVCGLSELAVCYTFGIALIYVLEKNDLYKKLFR